MYWMRCLMILCVGCVCVSDDVCVCECECVCVSDYVCVCE